MVGRGTKTFSYGSAKLELIMHARVLVETERAVKHWHYMYCQTPSMKMTP